MAWSVIDLSSITDELIALLTDSFASTAPVWKDNGGPLNRFDVNISGSMPETVREDGTCQLSLYLLHVSQDSFYRNMPVPGPYPQINTKNPLSLDLYYLLTAYAKDKYNHEQQAMSIALRCFHENAIVTKPADSEHYTLTMEVETADEIARIWQALSTPLRLSVVYKVSVAFITPSEEPSEARPRPDSVGLAVMPTGSVSVAPARLFGAAVRESFIVPPGADAGHADTIPFVATPGLTRPGDDLFVTGDGLDNTDYLNIYLTPKSGASEYDISTWRKETASPDGLRVHFPESVGTPPAASPAPGRYSLRVGSGATKRSNDIDIAVAAFIDNKVTPPALSPHPLTPDAGGVYTVKGLGFTTAKTEVFLGDVPLSKVNTPPGAGEFQIDSTETSFKFKRPAALPHGRYQLRIRVNGIESPPSWTVHA